jgi:hypothetical protein
MPVNPGTFEAEAKLSRPYLKTQHPNKRGRSTAQVVEDWSVMHKAVVQILIPVERQHIMARAHGGAKLLTL